MTFSKKILTSAVLLASSSIALAATDSTDIEINVTKDAYVNLIGSLSGNTSVALADTDVDGNTTVLGTLGTESNTTGSCDITVTSLKDYRLEHTTSAGLYLHGAANYSVNYGGASFVSGPVVPLTQPNCNQVASDLSITSPALPGVVQAGTYTDTLTVTVTTQ